MEAIAPDDIKGLRACIACSLVKTEAQFLDRGCENCNHFIFDRTFLSGNFYGLIAVLDPKDSWVARAQNLSRHDIRTVQLNYYDLGWAVPGCYAMSIVGSLSDEIVQELQEPIRKRYLAMKSKAQ